MLITTTMKKRTDPKAKHMKAFKVVAGLLALFLSLPIGLYLQYRILQMVGATNVMWLLFWVNLPTLIFFQVVAKIAEVAKDD